MPAPPIPELGLAEAWEENRDLRRAAVKRGGLLDWGPNPKKNGVPSLETLSYNSQAIQAAIDLWCPSHSTAKTLPEDVVKAEVGDLGKLVYC